MIPRLLDRERRLALAAVVGLGLMEAACLAGAVVFVGGAVETASMQGLAGALGFALLAGAVSWARQVMAEDFGARYSGALRRYLAHAAVQGAGEGKPGRLGLMAVRMTGDLNALRDWASVGLGEAAASAALLSAGLAILAWTAGVSGLAIGLAALAPTALAVALLAAPLIGAHRRLRQERGRVASLSGDVLNAARTVWALGAADRESKRLDRRSDDLRRASVLRRALAAGVQTQALLVLGAGGVCAVLLERARHIPALAAGDWAQVLLALGFLATSAAGFARALDAACAYHVGFSRLAQLDDEPAPPETLASNPEPESADDQPLALGEVRWISSADPQQAHARLEALWSRRAASEAERAHSLLVAPSMPLVRASLRRNLTLARVSPNRPPNRAALQRALRAAGLNPKEWPLAVLIDPLDPGLDAWTQARVRLARAVASAPLVLYVAEPLLAAEPDYAGMLHAIAAEHGCAVLAARPIGAHARAALG